MKLKKISSLYLAASALLVTSSAMAWESENGAHSTSASVALSTDYIWRGYSQTDNDPAISGSFDYAHSSGFYLGTWASNVDFGDDASVEIDLYAGIAGETEGGLGWDVGVLRYFYDGEDYDWTEVYASLSYSFFSVGIAHSNNVYDTDESGTYYSLGFDYDLPMDIALGAGVGYYDYDSNVYSASSEEHVDYRIGISKEFVGFGWDLTYTGMDSDGRDDVTGNGDLGDGRLVFTISKSM
ncbi:MAG: hypothetical protein COB23_01215 [Methylophaga sp.]|nr:MAG: hypothetical protein COB23_01215 [Methylophaga sp.]